MLMNLTDKVSTLFKNFLSRPCFLMVLVIRASFYIFVENNSGMLFFGFEFIEVSREEVNSLSSISQPTFQRFQY